MRPRTLAILSAVVAVLAIVVMIDRPRRPGRAAAADRLLPGFDPEAVTRLAIRDVVVERQGDGFAIAAPISAPADDAVVRELLADLAFMRLRRRVELPASELASRGLDPPRSVVTVTGGAVTHTLRIGHEDAALSRVWAALDGRVVLIDPHAARALDRGLDDLRDHAPFRPPSGVTSISIDTPSSRVQLGGKPACVAIAGRCARADPDRFARLVQRLRDLRVTRFVRDDAGAPPSAAAAKLHVIFGRDHLVVTAPCPGGGWRALSRLGTDACVDSAVVDELTAAADARAWIDRALLAMSPQAVHRIELSAGALERHGGEWRFVRPGGDSSPAASSSVRTWLDDLAAARADALVDAPATRPLATLTVTGAAGSETLHVHPGNLVQRAGEAVALQVTPEVARLLAADELQFRDRQLLSFEPFALTAVEVAGEARAVRGETADDWTLHAPAAGAADAEAIATLRDAASDLVAERVLAARAAPAHRLPRRTLILDLDAPPTGAAAPAQLRLELGARFPDGTCAARKPGEETVYLLGAPDCDALDLPLLQRR